MKLPFVDLRTQYHALQSEIMGRIKEVLEHGQYIMGPEVAELEERIISLIGAKNCITVSSGTDALLISLMAAGVGKGHEVITTPFTFVATAEVIALLGAVPVFVDIDPKTCNIDAAKIAQRVTKRTRAIIPVSLYGQMSDMDAINAIASSYQNIIVIEDAAQSFGATYKGRNSGTVSKMACTSFFPSKPLGCYGDGGAIFSDCDELAQACREIRVHGQSSRYVHTRVGVGGRMDTIQCAILLAKLSRFEWEIEQRQRIALRYDAMISDRFGSDQDRIQLPYIEAHNTSVYAQYTVQVKDRENMQARLDSAGIPTAIHYPVPLNEQPAYREFSALGETPVASLVAKRVISLPMHADLSEKDQERIVSAI